MKTILVPTDFSLAADNALQYAIPIALKEGASIMLVHAFKIDPVFSRAAFPTHFIEDEIEHVRRRANHHLEATCDFVEKGSSIKCEYMSVLGVPTDVIRKVARQLRPRMIVMGTNGASGFTGKLIGSTAANVISKASCPVIAVPATARYHGVKNILYASDLRQKASDTTKRIKELTGLFPAHISVVHICNSTEVEHDKELLQQFKTKAKRALGNISYRLIVADDINGQLLKMAKSKRFDLLVMTTHRRSFVESLFNRSATKKVANAIQIPLLAFQSK